MMRRMRAWAGLALAGSLMLTGCSFGTDLYSMPLPGGVDVGDDPITITADFDDVVDLVPQSSVKVEHIAVGRVESIKLNPDGRSARATLVVRNDVDLPQGTTARLEQTSLLGEKYVALVRPAADAPLLTSGANIPIEDTSQIAEVEQVLGALSLVVNGGGLAKFQEISKELQQVSTDRPDEIRGFLRNMGTFMAGMDARKGAITDALEAMAGLSKTLDTDRDKISTALEGLSPGIQVLADQREQLVSMLSALDKLSDVSVRTLNASQRNMVEDMKLMEPILGELAEAGEALPHSLELLLTYPFPDSVLGVIKGDYFNVFATATYTSLPASCTGLGCPWPQLPDTTTLPPIDPFARVPARPVLPGTVLTTPPTVDPTDGPSSPATTAPPTSTAPSTTPSSPVSPSLTTPSESPTTTAPAQGLDEDAGDDVDPTGGSTEAPSDDVTPGATPSLLPPTDSAVPGLAQRSVQIPVSRRAR